MTNHHSASQPNMLHLLPSYALYFVAALAAFVGIGWLLGTYAEVAMPFYLVMIIAPMMGAMGAAKTFVQRSARAPGFGYSVIFGALATVIALAAVWFALSGGYLDSMIDAIAQSERERAMAGQMILILVGGFAAFANIIFFWAMGRGEIKRREKEAASGR